MSETLQPLLHPLSRAIRKARLATLLALPEWRIFERPVAYLDHIVHQRELPVGPPARSHSQSLTHLRVSGALADPLRQLITDKEFAKLYVRARVGDEFVIPTLLVTPSAEEASTYVDAAPMIAKATHASGQMRILRAGETLPRSLAEDWLSFNFYRISREANYRYLQPKIIFEPFLGENGKPPYDYKVFCFHGRPKFIRVSIDRYGDYTAATYDTNWKRLAFTIKHPQGPDIPRPAQLREMCRIASELSKPFDQLRVDLYCCGDKTYVGELTNCHGGLRERYAPPEADNFVGRFLMDPHLTADEAFASLAPPADATPETVLP